MSASPYPFIAGALGSIAEMSGDDITRWVDYATKYPKDAGYAMQQLLLVADTLKRAKFTAEQMAERQLAREAA